MSNKYLYQSKEFESDLGLDIYDFHARQYDPTLGRTFQIDPHSENYLEWSPYSWTGNNPLINIDPTGMDWYQNDETGELVWHVPTKHEDGTTNATLAGHTYLAGADATFEQVRDNYNFVNGDNTFGGDNLMTFLDHQLSQLSKDDLGGFDQKGGIAFTDESGGGESNPTGMKAEHTEMVDGYALSAAAGGASAGKLSGSSLDIAEGLNKVKEVVAELFGGGIPESPDTVQRQKLLIQEDGSYKWQPYIWVKTPQGGIMPVRIPNKNDSTKFNIK